MREASKNFNRKAPPGLADAGDATTASNGSSSTPLDGITKAFVIQSGQYLDLISSNDYGYWASQAVCALGSGNDLWCWGQGASGQGPDLPYAYTEASLRVTAVFDYCTNGWTNPSFIDYAGHFHSGGAAASPQITCPQ